MFKDLKNILSAFLVDKNMSFHLDVNLKHRWLTKEKSESRNACSEFFYDSDVAKANRRPSHSPSLNIFLSGLCVEMSAAHSINGYSPKRSASFLLPSKRL
jgi:hypothetical protein